MQKLLGSILVLIFFTIESYADPYRGLVNLWNQSKGTAVQTSPNYYKGQNAGHYTLGSAYFARPKQNRPLVSVNFPEFNWDKNCYAQGVLNFGGASFISGPELMNKLQAIVTEAGMMYVYQGISAISPVIGETLQEVYSKLQEIGGFLSDECQAAKQLNGIVGNVLTQHSSMAQSLYSSFRQESGDTKDISGAYRDYPNKRNAVLGETAAKDERLALQDINLAWKALNKISDTNSELKEFMMSVSGTIIIKAPSNDGGHPTFTYISSNITSPELLKTMLKGSDELPILKCKDTNKCLEVAKDKKSISKSDSFENLVATYFDKFREAIANDTPISDDNSDVHSFLSSSGLPVYKIYDVLYQYTNANPQYEQGAFVEIVAWNILYNYLSDTIKQVTEATNNLQISASTQLNEFKESLIQTQKMLSSLEMRDLTRYEMQLFLINRAEKYEQAMATEVSKIYSSRRS
jgi:conjugative transfer pilus assembly protein TraH